MLIDTHVHLCSFSDIPEVIENSRRKNIQAILAVGGNQESSIECLDLSKEYPKYVFPGMGIHPSEILNEDIKNTIQLIEDSSSELVAIGEIGLDYHYSFAKEERVREKQRQVYIELLRVANNAELPVSIHSRAAYSDSLNLLLENGPEKAVFHWYDGPLSTLNEILDQGFYVSATPAIEYSKGHRKVMEDTPLERILVETDSPIYLRSLKRRSEPSDILLTLVELAKIKEQDLEKVIEVTGRNAMQLFDKMRL
jgi:TatD DNase family protein